MRRSVSVLSTLIALCASPLVAAAPSLGGDLTATIVLNGMPCDKVVNAKRNSDSDYTATCRDGNRYHVYVDASGRVVVQKL